ncbi:hypothetical protein [Trinickia fusca]|uniref:Uncharacterized protein n=1 Tax=Trinickia fusca TaxID=2419777 RepID=A0A494XED7_9BURK|nr:hypothetical protein [Trinickia fusca]RKP48242.1 hypothetical protein D7S89_13020 [Trinickia fusca]
MYKSCWLKEQVVTNGRQFLDLLRLAARTRDGLDLKATLALRNHLDKLKGGGKGTFPDEVAGAAMVGRVFEHIVFTRDDLRLIRTLRAFAREEGIDCLRTIRRLRAIALEESHDGCQGWDPVLRKSDFVALGMQASISIAVNDIASQGNGTEGGRDAAYRNLMARVSCRDSDARDAFKKTSLGKAYWDQTEKLRDWVEGRGILLPVPCPGSPQTVGCFSW